MNKNLNSKLLDKLVQIISEVIRAKVARGETYEFQEIKHFFLNSYKKELGGQMAEYSSEISKIFRARADGKIKEALAEKAAKRRIMEGAKQLELEEKIRSGIIPKPLKKKELHAHDKIFAGKIKKLAGKTEKLTGKIKK